MVDPKAPSIDSLRIIYKEIVDGVSFCFKKGVYFKHLSELDQISILKQKETFTEKYESQGVQYEKDRIKQLIESEEWSAKKEDDIESLRLSISDNDQLVKKIVVASQRDAINKIIKQKKDELSALLIERYYCLGTTIEKLVDRDLKLFEIFILTYKDIQCQKRQFDDFDDLDNLSDDEIVGYQDEYNKSLDRINERNIRFISICPFFLNVLSHCRESIYDFFGKSAVNLTTFQLYLISCGRRNIDIMSRTEQNPPEISSENSISDVLTWFDQKHSELLKKPIS